MSNRERKRPKYECIPKRWLGCPRKSLQLLVGKFLIFKTPLDHKYDDQVPDECLFPVDFVFNSMKSYKVNLGLWIDLTNTTRFYDRRDVESHGCKYIKLQCRGFGETPSVEQTETFIAICHNFINQHPLEIIGIHCTHGFNRSGFMLVSFLVEKYDWELGAALLKFAEVRPPGIYKKDYIEELYRRYDDVEYLPQPPPLPDWCFEESDEEYELTFDNKSDKNTGNDDNENEEEYENDEDNEDKTNDDGNDDNNDSDDDSNEQNIDEEINENKVKEKSKKRKRKNDKFNGKQKRRKKELTIKNPTFMPGVPGVELVHEPLLGKIQKKVQELCNWKR